MPLAKLPLAAGRGMDRATGLVAARPENPVDARNVYARDAKMALRPGLSGVPYPPLPWGTDVLCIIPSKATGDVLFCVYDRTVYELRIFRLDPVTPALQALTSPPNGLWGTLSPLAPFPVVNAAEADGLIMFAHDEAALLFRLPTIYYTPDFVTPANPGSLTTLTANLDGTGGATLPVYFRGVTAYLEYMIGWGYGQAADPDRGDIGRLSLPTQPTVFSPENYFIAGAKKDPIRLCLPATDPGTTLTVLAIGKENEAYRLVGSSPIDFGIQLLDPRYGVISSRAGINVGGVAYWWSTDGLRRVTPAGTSPISQPLELLSPLPVSLPALGPAREAFIAFDRRRYLLEMLFPNLVPAAVRTPGFALSLWDPQDPRWTFVVKEQCLACAGEILLSDDLAVPAPTGYCSAVAGVDSGLAADARYRSGTISWVNNDYIGDEVVQIFGRPAGGAWSVLVSVPVSGPAQSTTVSTLLPLTNYDIGLRFVRGTATAVGYAGDPDAWTAGTAAGAKDNFDTTSAAVAWVSGAFVAPAGPANLTWASAQLDVTYLLEKKVGAVFVTVVADLLATNYAYGPSGAELGTTIEFRVTAQRGAIVGPTAGSLMVDMFVSVGAVAWVSAVWSVATGFAALTWAIGAGVATTFIEKTADGGGTWSPVATVPGTTYDYAPTAAELNTTLGFRLTGKDGTGSTSGATSATQNVTFTVALGAPTAFAAAMILYHAPFYRFQITWTLAAGDQQFVLINFGADYVGPTLEIGNRLGVASGWVVDIREELFVGAGSMAVSPNASIASGFGTGAGFLGSARMTTTAVP